MEVGVASSSVLEQRVNVDVRLCPFCQNTFTNIWSSPETTIVEIDDFQVKILLYKLALHKTPHRNMSRHYTRINYCLVMFYLAVQFYFIGKDSPRPVLQNSEEYKKDAPEFTTLTS